MKVVYSQNKSVKIPYWSCCLTKDDGEVFVIDGCYAEGIGEDKNIAKRNLQTQMARYIERTTREWSEALKLVTES